MIMKRSLSILGVLMMTIVTMSGAAQASVAHDEADWGMRYDWTNLDVDSQTVLGTSFTQIVDNLEADMAAEGINLDIDEAAATAEADGSLAMPPTQMPPPIGYIRMAKDPDGNTIEFSYDQGIYATVQEVWG